MVDQPKPRPLEDLGDFRAYPKPPVIRWTRPVVRFLQVESVAGFMLLGCAIIALVLANSPLGEHYLAIWETPIDVTIGGFEIMDSSHGHNTLRYWINDALMVIFFFVVGLEIKREMVMGELSDWKKATLPAMAALGGMVVPAGIYLAQHAGGPGERGWGVPMATDIAFVVGVMALLGKRVPMSLKIMLLSLAIADDIGAVLVIAVAYTDHLVWEWLLAGGAGFLLCYVFNRIGVRAVGVYFIVGVGVWLCFVKSGVHPTVAGVMLGMLTPANAWVGDQTLLEVLNEAIERLNISGTSHGHHGHNPTHRTMYQLSTAAREAVSPLERLETSLHPWVSFIIMPLFALANAGVVFEMSKASDPIAIGVATGLFFGKPIGVLLFSFLAVSLGIASLPRGINWKIMLGGGFLAGIGFTMALFINGLAFEKDAGSLDAGKVGVLIASLFSAVIGSILLLWFLPREVGHAHDEESLDDDEHDLTRAE